MNRNPLMTVVTVSYNAAATIEKTIQSVLSQSYSNIEYIIIDGGSTDGTVDIIKKYADRIACWVSEPDKGIYDAMNKGILKSTGQWINFMNVGDWFNNDNVISELVSSIDNDATIVYGDIIKMLPDIQYYEKAESLDLLKEKMVFSHQAMFVRTDYHKQHLFDLSFRSSADYNFIYNSFFKGKVLFQYIPLLIANYDESDGMSKDNWILAYRENYKVWGIENDRKKFLIMEFKLFKIKIRKLIKRILPESLNQKIQRSLLKKRGFNVVMK